MKIWFRILLMNLALCRGWVSRSIARLGPLSGAPGVVGLTRLWGNGRRGNLPELGFNELHTLLRDAVRKEDYVEAGRISDILLERLYGKDLSADERRLRRGRLSWKGLGAAPWLTERLDALNYTFPTTIQINALEAVNAILGDNSEDTSMQERVDMQVEKSMGVVVSGTTGSGKVRISKM